MSDLICRRCPDQVESNPGTRSSLRRWCAASCSTASDATGVEFNRGGVVEHTEADHEVIPSAGAVSSPHILQLSGVGAPSIWAASAFRRTTTCPGVGQNLQDHYIARIGYPVQGMGTVNERSRGIALAGLRYLVIGRSMLTYRASLAGASVKVLEQAAAPDMQCSIAPGSFKDGQIGASGRSALRAAPGVDDFPGITAGA